MPSERILRRESDGPLGTMAPKGPLCFWLGCRLGRVPTIVLPSPLLKLITLAPIPLHTFHITSGLLVHPLPTPAPGGPHYAHSFD